MFIVVWNALFVLDGFVPWKEPRMPGLFVQLALGLAFSVAVLTQRSKTMQYWVLRPGRSVGEIRPLNTIDHSEARPRNVGNAVVILYISLGRGIVREHYEE